MASGIDKTKEFWNRMASAPIDASVIDPNDRLGFKNQYISQLRDQRILEAVGDDSLSEIALDIGCGTGGLTQALASRVPSVLGLDISERLLYRTAERSFAGNVAFVQYDGQAFPMYSSSVNLVVTYGVLIYLLENEDLQRILQECYRVLVPGGRAIFVEQVGHRECFIRSEMKRRFDLVELIEQFTRSGLVLRHDRVVRYGRFPLLLPIRFGLIPRAAFPFVGRLEAALGKVLRVPRYTYCDMLFELEKVPGMG